MSEVHVYDHGRQFVMVPLEVLEVLEGERIALALYVWLRRYANKQGSGVHPSRRTLAKHLGYKTGKSVDDALSLLKRLGLVETFARFRNEKGEVSFEKSAEFMHQTSNGYVIYDMPNYAGQTPTKIVVPPSNSSSSPPSYSSSSPPTTRVVTDLDPNKLDPNDLGDLSRRSTTRGAAKAAHPSPLEEARAAYERPSAGPMPIEKYPAGWAARRCPACGSGPGEVCVEGGVGRVMPHMQRGG